MQCSSNVIGSEEKMKVDSVYEGSKNAEEKESTERSAIENFILRQESGDRHFSVRKFTKLSVIIFAHI